jgi:hypothetical protein
MITHECTYLERLMLRYKKKRCQKLNKLSTYISIVCRSMNVHNWEPGVTSVNSWKSEQWSQFACDESILWWCYARLVAKWAWWLGVWSVSALMLQYRGDFKMCIQFTTGSDTKSFQLTVVYLLIKEKSVLTIIKRWLWSTEHCSDDNFLYIFQPHSPYVKDFPNLDC